MLFRSDKSKNPEKKQQTRGNYQNRGRAQQNNKKDGNRRAQRPQAKRQPTIYIKTPIDQIKLNDAQAEKIKEYDEKLHQLNPCTPPSEQDFNKKIGDFDKKNNQIKGSIETYRSMIEEEDRKRDAFLQKNAGVDFKSLQNLREDVKGLLEKRNSIEKEFEDAKNKLKKLQSNINEVQNKYGLKNLDDAMKMIDEIDHRIEVSSLTSTELKKLMSKRERYLGAIDELTKVDGIIKEVDETKKQRDQLFAEKKKVNDEIEQSIQKRNQTKTQLDSLNGETKKFREQKDTYYAKIKELYQEQKKLNEEENKTKSEYRKAVDEYRKKLQEITELEYQKKVIYREAERIQLQIEESQKKIGEIQERVNPHQKEIDTAKSLIVYLEELKLDHKEEAKPVVKESKGNNKEAAALINSVRKPQKGKQQKGKQQKGKKNSSCLTHTLDAMGQFAAVDIQAPKQVTEIAGIIEKLQEKVKAWESEFIKANVNFTVSEDGKVKVTVTLS